MKKWFKFCEERTTTISVSSSASCDADSLPAIEINIDTRKLKPCPPGHYLVILNKNYIKNKNFSINLFFIWDLWPFYTFKSNDDIESVSEDPLFFTIYAFWLFWVSTYVFMTWPVICSISPPDYRCLLTSLQPLEDRDTVEVWTFPCYQYFIFSFDHLGRVSIWECCSVSGGVRTLHRPTLSAAWSAGQETAPHTGEEDPLWRTLRHLYLLSDTDWCRLE